MTGRDSFRTGMQFEELTNFMPWGLPLDEVTLAERFKSAGYATHMVSEYRIYLNNTSRTVIKIKPVTIIARASSYPRLGLQSRCGDKPLEIGV